MRKGGLSLWVGGGLVTLALAVAIFAPLIALTDPVMGANLMNAVGRNLAVVLDQGVKENKFQG